MQRGPTANRSRACRRFTPALVSVLLGSIALGCAMDMDDPALVEDEGEVAVCEEAMTTEGGPMGGGPIVAAPCTKDPNCIRNCTTMGDWGQLLCDLFAKDPISCHEGNTDREVKCKNGCPCSSYP